MESGKTLRRFQLGGNRRHRHRRGIGGENALGRDDLFKLAEQRTFGIEVFDNRLDDHVTGFELGH